MVRASVGRTKRLGFQIYIWIQLGWLVSSLLFMFAAQCTAFSVPVYAPAYTPDFA